VNDSEEHHSHLDKMLDKKPIDFETNSGAAPHDAGASNSIDVSGPVVNLESDADTQPTTGCGKDSVTSLKEKTPAKRPTSSQKLWSHS
ncbi:hypothetical protein PIB30_107848, partial [Stylosanthes scabra]|nr:hypothetical protein [Stylosanthes scabra]